MKGFVSWMGVALLSFILIVPFASMTVDALTIYGKELPDNVEYGLISNITTTYYVDAPYGVQFNYSLAPACSITCGTDHYYSFRDWSWHTDTIALVMTVDAHYNGIQISQATVRFDTFPVVNDTVYLGLAFNDTRYTAYLVPEPGTNITVDIKNNEHYVILTSVEGAYELPYQIPSEARLYTYLIEIMAFLTILGFAFAASYMMEGDFFNLSIWSIVICIGISVFIYTGLFGMWMLVFVAGMYTYMLLRW